MENMQVRCLGVGVPIDHMGWPQMMGLSHLILDNSGLEV